MRLRERWGIAQRAGRRWDEGRDDVAGGEDWTLFRAQRIAELIELGFTDEEAAAEGRRQEARSRARMEWGLDMMERLDAAQAEADAAWKRLCDANEALDDEAFDALPATPEQERLEALLSQVDDLVERGRFPAHLHFHGV